MADVPLKSHDVVQRRVDGLERHCEYSAIGIVSGNLKLPRIAFRTFYKVPSGLFLSENSFNHYTVS